MRKTILLVCALVLTLAASMPARAQTPPLTVYYAGSQDAVYTALGLAEGELNMVDDPGAADVWVLNGIIDDPATSRAHLESGGGLLLILGPALSQSQVSEALGSAVTLTLREDALSLESTRRLASDILWSSAPQVFDRTEVTGLQAAPLVMGHGDGEVVLSALARSAAGGGDSEGRAFVLTPHMGDANPAFREWFYFNYLIYDLTIRAAGRTPRSFADYPASPVPHAAERGALLLILTGMAATAVVAFLLVRRYSLRHPEKLDQLVISREDYEAREAHSAWEQVGFHRPASGFLFAMMMGLLIYIPLLIYQTLIFPTYILPSAQALGLWGRVTQFFGLAWTLFDLGTGIAFIKFFSQYRVHDPRRAVQFGQVFVWWQALSGAFQVGLVVLLAGTVVPHTTYAIYTWLIIAHTFIQVPGFFAVMRNAMFAQQRLDYAQILDNAWALLWPIVTQLMFVPVFIAWGRAHPAAGPAFGGVIGLAAAGWMVEMLNFLLGLWLYRRAGYNAGLFFLAHFDLSVVKQAFRFGIFEMAGAVAFAAGQALEVLITQTRLVNYAEVWGNWIIAANFAFAYSVIQNLNDSVMPGISEAVSNTKRKLSQYYASMTYKWAAFVAAFITAVLLAVADRVILGSSGPQFARAAMYVIPLIFWGCFQHLGTIGDAIAQGSNRPGIKTLMILGEQGLRISLAVVLVQQYQVAGLIAAYLIAELVRGVAAFFINNRYCFPLHYYPWQSLVAPLMAGTLQYLLLRWLTGLVWNGTPETSILILVIGLLFSYPVYTFLYGLFGGWDDATLAEMRHASEMMPFLRFMGSAFWRPSAFGASLSPLHNRFPISNRAEAIEEANRLTEERVHLV
jgi:O-antigen/teichoic acid export membrane protein